MDWRPVHVSQFPISSSPRHEPTTRHHTPEPKRRHNPDQGPSKPKGPSEPKHPKTGRHDRAKKPTGSGHRKSAPATAESSLPVGGQDLTNTPTLGSLPNRKRSNA
jgi:hypothetical protein